MSESDVLKDMLSLSEAAERLGLHRATVNDMVITGRLHGYRLGAHWYVRGADVERFSHEYRRPKNVPRRRSRVWAEQWKGEVVRWLNHWDSATTEELDRVIDLHIGNIRKYLVLLEGDGMAERDDYGYWRLTEPGRKWALSLPPIKSDGTAWKPHAPAVAG